ncbi:MAG: hypothetical protein BGO23_00660 [Solirubrobacterales bacterium 67-14]|nr:MAG: hypothetical protein BGO23_00660 [Solirubrobacterales bacterium 67-14]
MAIQPEALPEHGGSNGTDRKAFKLAIPVLVVAVLWVAVVPFVNHLLKYDDPIEKGDQLRLAPGITFTPAVGWNLEAGLRTSEKTRTHAPGAPVTLVDGAITMNVWAQPFKGTPDELASEIAKTPFSNDKETLSATGEKYPLMVQLAEAPWVLEAGVLEHYTAPDSEGLVAAFVVEGTGVSVRVVGPASQVDDQDDAIGEMLGSFSFDAKAAKAAQGGGK